MSGRPRNGTDPSRFLGVQVSLPVLPVENKGRLQKIQEMLREVTVTTGGRVNYRKHGLSLSGQFCPCNPQFTQYALISHHWNIAGRYND